MSLYTSPKSWGPHFWFILRCVANTYPVSPTPEDAKHVKSFFNELQFILPCDICKYSLSQHFKKHPIDNALAGKDKLVEWVEIIYNETKKVINDKRIKIMDSFDDTEEDIKPVRITYRPKENTFENYELLQQAPDEVFNNDNNFTNTNINYNLMPEIIPNRTDISQNQKENNAQEINFFKFEKKDTFGKINSGKKITEKKNNKRSENIINKNTNSAIIAGASDYENKIKKNMNNAIMANSLESMTSYDNRNIKYYATGDKKMDSATQSLTLKKCKKCDN